MSVMVVQIVPEGIIIGADKQIKITEIVKHDETGWPFENIRYDQRSKVMKWANGEIIMGYVGNARIDSNTRTDDWLKNFCERNKKYSSLQELCHKLKDELNEERIEEIIEPLIIHVAGFVDFEGIQIPQVFFIRNTYNLGPIGYEDVRKEFVCTEEFWHEQYFGKVQKKNIKNYLKCRPIFMPFWFHQGTDLIAFNILDKNLYNLFEDLFMKHQEHRKIPQKIEDWEKFVKMVILSYGSYFKAFKGSDQQLVADVDVVSLQWPL